MCVRDCIGEPPCRKRRKEAWEAGYPDVQTCCAGMPYKSFEDCGYGVTIEKRVGTVTTTTTEAPVDTRWYPGSGKCINDGQAPTWQHNRYTGQDTCCSSHFNWDYNNCMGISQRSTGLWYISWNMGKCVKDCEQSEGASCGGLIPGSWLATYDSAEWCCSVNMSYTSVRNCKYTG